MKRDRLEIWEELLNSGNLNVAKTSKIKKLVRKYGIPEYLRSKSWMAISGAKDRMVENEGMYAKLCEELLKAPSDSPHLLQINKDLERTTVAGITVDKVSLRRVLGAYSVLNADIGYCQVSSFPFKNHFILFDFKSSMNFIVSALMAVVSEEESFWLLVSIVEYILPEDYYSSSMVGVQSDIMVFKNILLKKYPRISNHLTAMDVRLDGLVLRWFLCLFVGVLPATSTFRALDLFFVEGDKALFRVCLTLFKINEKAILGTNDFEKVMDVIIKMPSNVNEDVFTETILSVDMMPGTKITSMRKHSLGALAKPSNLPSSISPPSSPPINPNPPKLQRNTSSPHLGLGFSPTRALRSITINARIPLNGPTTAPSPLSPRRASPQSSPKQSPPSPILQAPIAYYIPPPPPLPPKSYFETQTTTPTKKPKPLPPSKPLPPTPLSLSTEIPESTPMLTLKNAPTVIPPKSSEEIYLDKVLAGLPTSQPIKKSNSKLFRSPSSPVFSRTPPAAVLPTASTPSSPTSRATPAPPFAYSSPLFLSDGSEQAKLKRNNRRAKIDHSDAIPVLYQVSPRQAELGNLKYSRNWGFALAALNNTSSCAGDAGGGSEDDSPQIVDVQAEGE